MSHPNADIVDLFIKYLTGEITPFELKILNDWISASPDNKNHFNKFETSWLLSNEAKYKKQIDNNVIWNKLISDIRLNSEGKENKIIKKRNSILSLKIAASWLLFLALGSLLTWIILSKPGDNQNQLTEIVAPLGAKSLVKLPDGTSVWLNAGSKLSYKNDFNVEDRKVMLSGEAFFSVFTNKAKPFTVHTSDIIIRAFGTKFNVKAYTEEKTITTTLEEGKIDITIRNKQNSFDNSVVLIPNQKIVYYKDNHSIHDPGKAQYVQKNTHDKISNISPISSKMVIASNINTELYTSWKDKRWIIEGVTFESLVPMLERRYNMKIAFKDEELKKFKFTGTIQNETIEQIMAALTFTAPMNFKIVRDSVSLSIDPLLKAKYKKIITTAK